MGGLTREDEVQAALGGRALGLPDVAAGYHGSAWMEATASAFTSSSGALAGIRR
ncbi:MAG: hypothetical protein M0Z63_10955 [Actinomycetota bacterium]|nr:hypothetical protein [Actinomycetota bacterium]